MPTKVIGERYLVKGVYIEVYKRGVTLLRKGGTIEVFEQGNRLVTTNDENDLWASLGSPLRPGKYAEMVGRRCGLITGS
jgi:hypothetical protein